MKSKKQKLTNLVKAGIISLPLIFGNPSTNAKAQERYESKYNTIAHEMVRIEQQHRYSQCYSPKKKLLDDLIDESKEYIPQKEEYTSEEGKKILKKISDHIPRKDKTSYDLQDVCYRQSLMMLAVARANNLPVYLIEAPSHVLLRWDQDNKHDPLFPNAPENKGDFNFETIPWGEIQKDTEMGNSEYSLQDLDQKPVREGAYLKNLTDSQSIALAYLKGGDMYGNVEEYEKARKLIEKARKLSPQSLNIQIGLAYYQQRVGQYDKAIKNYKKILEMNPPIEGKKHLGTNFMSNAYLELAECLKEKGQPKKAEELIKKGQEHVPFISYLKRFW